MKETDCNVADVVIAGPILRRVSRRRIGLWLVTTHQTPLTLALFGPNDEAFAQIDTTAYRTAFRVGEHAIIQMLDIDLADAGAPELALDTPIGYDLLIGGEQASLAAAEPGLCYPGERIPRFILRQRLAHVLHGSCRRPHHPSGDGMRAADDWLAERRADPAGWPDLMLLTGDQIYADDVATPMLRAIHAAIERYGLLAETLEGATVPDSAALYASADTYGRRDALLPQERANRALRERFFGGTEKPVFTSASSANHLITLAEVLAMYLLTWSDTPWRGLHVQRPSLDAEQRERWDSEAPVIDEFVAELRQTRRLLANVPTVMIFDDHDITDDWNLTAEWADTAYGHPFSRRIIGNALIAYTLCQAWMNAPQPFSDTLAAPMNALFDQPSAKAQDRLIDSLLDFGDWHYTLDTEPAVVVLDTRMHRWRRTVKTHRPSGLMDWEALIDMQSALTGRRSAVIVSAAPVFGVKLIENVQKIFTFFGKPLMVDAENWMAHRGAAVAMLQILSHRRTPENFTILSGDVHYSFVYDVVLRHRPEAQRIWQIVSSGVKNEFPERLLTWFDRLNRWLYAPYSPLNWFTKRRRLKVSPRRPVGRGDAGRLLNQSGMGYVGFDDEGRPVDIVQIGTDGQRVRFKQTTDIET